jgi:hypothetical protein
MPDAGASRKRQIRVALRPFGDTAASGAVRKPIPHAAELFCRCSCKAAPYWASGDRSVRRLARRRFDVAARAIKVIKAMFDAVKRGTHSNWQGAFRIRWCARLDSLTAPRLHVATNSGFGAACERIWTAKNKGFCNFPSCTVGSLADGHKPKQQRASREPLI